MTNLETLNNGSAPRVVGKPRSRRAAYAGEVIQDLVADRDNLERECAALKTSIAGHVVELEALRSRLADMESRVATATLVRDQAVADRAVYETLFISVQAQLRAFKIPAAPLVRESEQPPAESTPNGDA